MIGIVILNYQNWEDTFCCVQSIWDNPPNESFQIILVDNASPNMPEYDLDAMIQEYEICLLYTSPSPRDRQKSRMPSSA